MKHSFILDGAKILGEYWDGNTLIPLYDNEDNVCGILHNDIPYYFLKNLQGDVIAITNQRGETVARYTYDAWGSCTITYDATATPTVEGGETINIATVNPFRYRSYYFDTETGLYYLQSRYYDPALGRFVNGDDAVAALIASTEVRPNFYLYCNNNAVSMTDPTGFMTAAAIAVNFVSAAGYAGVANSWNVVGWVILAVVLVVIIAICIWNIAKAVKNAKKNAQVKAALLLNFASTAATPPPPNKGGKGTKVTSRTLYNKNGVHIDVENPGNRKGQIHLQKGNQKYIYNIQKQAFYNTKTGLKAPKAIQDLLLLPEVIEAIAKGLQYLGYFL